MSELNISGLVATIKETSVYTALVEAVNNAMQSIEATERSDGKVLIELNRSKPTLGLKFDGENDETSLPSITSVRISDNGQGFTDKNVKSFDEAYTRNKVEIGGKGFGRFVYLKHFKSVDIESVYKTDEGYKKRAFKLGSIHDIVEDLKDSDAKNSIDTWTTVNLSNQREKELGLDKQVGTVARKLLEKILIHFTREGVILPEIKVTDDYTGNEVILNDLLGDSKYAEIQRLETEKFAIEAGETYEFQVHLFKVWFPNNQKSKISLASHSLEVTKTDLSDYINEFESGFVGKFANSSGQSSNRFIIKSYVTGAYLDKHVNTERVDFDFGNKSDSIYLIGKKEIESAAADIIRNKFGKQFQTERKKKTERLTEITTQKKWLKKYESKVDLASLKVGMSEDDYEIALEVARIKEDQQLSVDIETLIKSDIQKLADEHVEKIISHVSESNKEDLARYVAKRKAVLDILDKSMKTSAETGRYSTEKVIHDIIYPTNTDSDTLDPEFQNLWMLDERLNFTEFVASDKRLSPQNASRPDLLLFHQQVAFRAGDKKQNPISIVEFKRPGRDEFASASSSENPIRQITRYRNDIREGKYLAPGGRPIHTDDETQFYGYVVVDFTEKVKKWLRLDEDFTPMPDGLGYFKFFTNTNLYVEVLSWDKVLQDSQLRNQIFMDKLGL
ncbi:MAG: ATP-binding protein [Candidatus Microsaccharimonas sp.]